MKRVQTKQSKKLTLGKMTVAKLRITSQQMKQMFGGNDTKPTTNGCPTIIIKTSLVDQNTCGDPITANNPTGG
jgi:V8-like Glu-specific endopeptidase